MFKEIIKKKYIISKIEAISERSNIDIIRQLDIALMNVGFKLSFESINYLIRINNIQKWANEIISSVKEILGDQVRYNVYFIDFPKNVPDTEEFWIECLEDALQNVDEEDKKQIIFDLSIGFINLLNLPKYGKYLHSYEEMSKRRESLVDDILNKNFKILHLGDSLDKESNKLYIEMASSVSILNQEDRKLLKKLAEYCIDLDQPNKIPIRENKAIVNAINILHDKNIIIDTPTDILRIACELSNGDVTLVENTKFKSFPKKIRKRLLKNLNNVSSGYKITDINKYSEKWKRLGEKLHPHEYPFSFAQKAFSLARGEICEKSIATQVEEAFKQKNISKANELLAIMPGMYFRNIDRLLRYTNNDQFENISNTLSRILPNVSGRVILSVLQHLQNRDVATEEKSRIYANKKGKVYVEEDKRDPLDSDWIETIFNLSEEELIKRLPKIEHLVINPDIYDVAIPLSDKNKASGFEIMPRGTTSPIDSVDEKFLRFFIYWKQKEEKTDYDLSVILLDNEFKDMGQISWTNLRQGKNENYVHSGDIVSAPDGASEFIDVSLSKLTNIKYIVPQINIYQGEGFDKVEECFFGYMIRSSEQKGLPYEPKTVCMRGDIRGKGKISLPLIFINNEIQWKAKWLHLYLNGRIKCNQVENNKISTSLIIKNIVNYNYLKIKYLIDLLVEKTDTISMYSSDIKIYDKDSTYIGIHQEENIKNIHKIYTLNNLSELIPI